MACLRSRVGLPRRQDRHPRHGAGRAPRPHSALVSRAGSPARQHSIAAGAHRNPRQGHTPPCRGNAGQPPGSNASTARASGHATGAKQACISTASTNASRRLDAPDRRRHRRHPAPAMVVEAQTADCHSRQARPHSDCPPRFASADFRATSSSCHPARATYTCTCACPNSRSGSCPGSRSGACSGSRSSSSSHLAGSGCRISRQGE